MDSINYIRNQSKVYVNKIKNLKIYLSHGCFMLFSYLFISQGFMCEVKIKVLFKLLGKSMFV